MEVDFENDNTAGCPGTYTIVDKDSLAPIDLASYPYLSIDGDGYISIDES